MCLPSYHGEDLSKRQVMERLHTLQKSGSWEQRPLYWNGRAGSLVGSLLQGEDLNAWERMFGLPKWLALALDGLFASTSDVQQGVSAGIDLLDTVPAGADVRTAGNRVLRDLLESAEYGLAVLLPSGPMVDKLHDVAALHQCRLDGTEVTPALWRRTRRQALALTDARGGGATEAMVGACIEAAAWDPVSSRTAVSDTCRCWIGAMAQAAVARQSDWTAEDDANTEALFGRLHAEAKAKAVDEGDAINVLKLLEEQHPQHAARLHKHQNLLMAEYTGQWQRAVNCLQRALAVEAVGTSSAGV